MAAAASSPVCPWPKLLLQSGLAASTPTSSPSAAHSPLPESRAVASSHSSWSSFSSKRSKTFYNWLYLLFKHLKGNIKTCSRVQQQVSKLFFSCLKKWYNRKSTLFPSEVNHSPALSLKQASKPFLSHKNVVYILFWPNCGTAILIN